MLVSRSLKRLYTVVSLFPPSFCCFTKHLGSQVQTVFFATHAGVSTLHDGLLTPVIEVREAVARFKNQRLVCVHEGQGGLVRRTQKP